MWKRLPNGSRLSCGRLARRRKGEGRQSVPARAQHSASLKTITARQLQALVRRQPRVTAGAPWGGQWYRYQTFQPERNLLTNAWPWDRLADGSSLGNRSSMTQVLLPTVGPHM